MAKARSRPTDAHRKVDKVTMKLKEGDLTPGDCVSTDQYNTRVPGRLGHTFGKEKKEMQYSGGTIYVDHASKLIHINNQVSLRVGETIIGKQAFEQMARDHGVTIKHYRSDNGVFATDAIKKHCKDRGQGYDFSGSGAHHQNAVAERGIQTISSLARACLIHSAIYWPEQVDLSLKVQRGDLMTNGFKRARFEELRLMVQGW